MPHPGTTILQQRIVLRSLAASCDVVKLQAEQLLSHLEDLEDHEPAQMGGVMTSIRRGVENLSAILQPLRWRRASRS